MHCCERARGCRDDVARRYSPMSSACRFAKDRAVSMADWGVLQRVFRGASMVAMTSCSRVKRGGENGEIGGCWREGRGEISSLTIPGIMKIIFTRIQVITVVRAIPTRPTHCLLASHTCLSSLFLKRVGSKNTPTLQAHNYSPRGSRLTVTVVRFVDDARMGNVIDFASGERIGVSSP